MIMVQMEESMGNKGGKIPLGYIVEKPFFVFYLFTGLSFLGVAIISKIPSSL